MPALHIEIIPRVSHASQIALNSLKYYSYNDICNINDVITDRILERS